MKPFLTRKKVCENAHFLCDFAHTTQKNNPYLCPVMNKKGKILIIDDNEDVLFALHLLLDSHVEKVRITTEPSRIDFFMRTFEPDVILLDMNFNRDAISGEEGFECLEQILSIDSEAVVIFMTAYADTEKAVRAIKAGATDFISKPWEKEKLLSTLFAALKLRESQQKVKLLKEQVVALSGQDEDKPEMIGESAVMKQVFNTIYKLSDTDANILILGENGTGKDLVARSIRFFSARKDRPFVSIDLGSIPETLFESELFGHEKGAFTDARTAKAGRIETAANGTLFLDEIGNLSPSMQSKLLTAIEKKEISRIGSTKTRPIDTRLICATNANIHQMVQDGTFRQDLLYRINTIEIHIPTLRERGADIILLAEHFIERYAHKYKKDIKGITRDGKLKLKKYSWPGNVRELQHAIERAIILSDGGWLTPASFMLQPPAESKTGLEDILNLEKLKATAIEIAMKRAKGNVSQAAELLGITRYALYRYLEKTE